MSLPFEIEKHLAEIETEIARLGAELVEASFRRSGSRGVLTILADKQGGISLEDCAAINRRLSDFFDVLGEKDPGFIQAPYVLEVNSPGLDRPLRTPRDFSRARGERLRVVYRDDTGKVLTVVGKLALAGESAAELEAGSSRILVAYASVIKAARDIRVNG